MYSGCYIVNMMMQGTPCILWTQSRTDLAFPFYLFLFSAWWSGSGRENRAGAIKEINVYGKSAGSPQRTVGRSSFPALRAGMAHAAEEVLMLRIEVKTREYFPVKYVLWLGEQHGIGTVFIVILSPLTVGCRKIIRRNSFGGLGSCAGAGMILCRKTHDKHSRKL